MSTTRTLDDRQQAVSRMIVALGRDPDEWDVDDLGWITATRAALDLLRDGVIYRIRDNGITDNQIAERLGVTRQAVSKRWPGGGRYVGAAGQYRTAQPDPEYLNR